MTLDAVKRLGAILVVLLGTASGVLLVSAAAEPAAGMLTVSVSGPTDAVGIPAPRYVVTATIANTSGADATGVTISSSFPDSDAREVITGVMGCDDSGLNADVCTVPDVPAGQNAVVTFRYAPTEYGIDRHHLMASSTGLGATDDADHDVRVSWPSTSTDWRVVVTPAVGMGGLRARHEVVVTNLGPATATNAVLDEQLQTGEQLVSTSLGQACAVQGAGVLHCALGTLAGRESATLVVDTKLPANPGERLPRRRRRQRHAGRERQPPLRQRAGGLRLALLDLRCVLVDDLPRHLRDAVGLHRPPGRDGARRGRLGDPPRRRARRAPTASSCSPTARSRTRPPRRPAPRPA